MKNLQTKISNIWTAKVILAGLLIIPFFTFAQQTKEQKKELRAAQNYLSEAQQSLQENQFVTAEADYRKAISLDPKNETAKYNLGTAYYGKKKNAEAMLRFKQAAITATTKAEKHRAFHNLGNTFMNEEKYQEAVDSYKNALRNNPNDEETRYNLALAKDMLDKNPPPPQDSDDQNQDKDQDKDNQDQNQDDKGDQGDDNKDQDKGDEKDDKADKDDEGKPDKPKDEDGDKPQQQQPVPGQLSPEQVKSLLEAMENEEKKVQDKINAEKQKGVKVKSDKDW